MQYNGKGEHYLQPMLACDLCLWVCGMAMWNINSMWLPQRHELMPSTHAPPPPANPSIQFAYSIPRYYLSIRHLHLITLVWMWVDHVLRGIVQCPCVSVADARWIMSPFPLAPILIYECRKWESIHYPFPATSLSIFHQSPCFAPIVAGSNHKTNISTHLLHSRPHATGLPVRQSSAQATLATTPNLLISTAIATFQYIHTHKMPIQWHWTRLSNFQIKQVLPHSKLAVLVRQIELNAWSLCCCVCVCVEATAPKTI